MHANAAHSATLLTIVPTTDSFLTSSDRAPWREHNHFARKEWDEGGRRSFFLCIKLDLLSNLDVTSLPRTTLSTTSGPTPRLTRALMSVRLREVKHIPNRTKKKGRKKKISNNRTTRECTRYALPHIKMFAPRTLTRYKTGTGSECLLLTFCSQGSLHSERWHYDVEDITLLFPWRIPSPDSPKVDITIM